MCEWVGIGEDDEEVVPCGRVATEVLRAPDGRLHHACAEHVATIRARIGGGTVEHHPGSLPRRPYPEAVL